MEPIERIFFYFQCYADVRRKTRELRDRETDTLIAVLRPVDGSCERGCMRDESAPIQLAQCRFPELAISNTTIYIFFEIKYVEAILSNSTRKLLWFEISKMLIAV